MTERWFGKNWGAECCDPRTAAATPVGRPCQRCREPIRLGDQGLMLPHVHFVDHVGVHATLEPTHLDCFLKSIRPHGPDCPHCRGKDIREHAPDCQRNVTGLCSCVPMPPAHWSSCTLVTDGGKCDCPAGEPHNPPDDAGERKA